MILNIAPCPKPRMTRSDRWRKRKIVLKYFSFCNQIRLLAGKENYKVDAILSVNFIIQMPKSWSKRRKLAMKDRPHQQRPDLSNLIKAFEDALCIEDSYIYKYRNCGKYWGEVGRIEVDEDACCQG